VVLAGQTVDALHAGGAEGRGEGVGDGGHAA
jgi:hypothetical protein